MCGRAPRLSVSSANAASSTTPPAMPMRPAFDKLRPSGDAAARAEPRRDESGRDEAACAEPGRDESGRDEPACAEPGDESARGEPGRDESARGEPVEPRARVFLGIRLRNSIIDA